jgi:hypothetical protein
LCTMKLEQVVACINLLNPVIGHVKAILSSKRMHDRAVMRG